VSSYYQTFFSSRFCNLCVNVLGKPSVTKIRDPRLKTGVKNCEAAGSLRTVRANVPYPIEVQNFCTPTTEQLEADMRARFGPNWRSFESYLKKVTIFMAYGNFVLHISSRKSCPRAFLVCYRGYELLKIFSRVNRAWKKRISPSEAPIKNDKLIKVFYPLLGQKILNNFLQIYFQIMAVFQIDYPDPIYLKKT